MAQSFVECANDFSCPRFSHPDLGCLEHRWGRGPSSPRVSFEGHGKTSVCKRSAVHLFRRSSGWVSLQHGPVDRGDSDPCRPWPMDTGRLSSHLAARAADSCRGNRATARPLLDEGRLRNGSLTPMPRRRSIRRKNRTQDSFDQMSMPESRVAHAGEQENRQQTDGGTVENAPRTITPDDLLCSIGDSDGAKHSHLSGIQHV